MREKLNIIQKSQSQLNKGFDFPTPVNPLNIDDLDGELKADLPDRDTSFPFPKVGVPMREPMRDTPWDMDDMDVDPPRPRSPSPNRSPNRQSTRKDSPSWGWLVSFVFEEFIFLGIMIGAVYLWRVGANCTLLAFVNIEIPVEQWGNWRWGIPAFFSAVEIFFWPKDWSFQSIVSIKFFIFILVSVCDVLSTIYGVYLWLKGREFAFAFGLTIPETGNMLIILTAIVSVVLTYGPERLGRWAYRQFILPFTLLMQSFGKQK